MIYQAAAGIRAAVAARTVFDATQAGASISACRGVTPRVALAVSASAAAVVVVNGDEVTLPVVAFVEGVRQPANSEGPELFLTSQFSKALDSALSMPVVFQHPTVDQGAAYVSINDPRQFDPNTGVRIGLVTDAGFDGDRLVLQVTIWLSKLRQAGPEGAALADAIVSGQQTEVSIGHWSRVLPIDGIYQGQPFMGVHTDILFDHLALLSLGQDGACSIKDGCGSSRQ
jgi:hypothetical protein